MTVLSSWSLFESMHPEEVYSLSTVDNLTFAPMEKEARSGGTRAGRTCATLWGTLKLSTPPSDPIPHCVFFRDSKLVMDSTTYTGIQALSEKVLVLLSTLTSYPESWHNWLERNDKLVIECLDLAQQALRNDVDWEADRLWAVGIVAALTTNIPPYSNRLREKLSSLSWTNQVAVEIEMAKDFEPAVRHRYEFLRHRVKDHESGDKAPKECLDRAALFAHYDTIRVKRLPTRESNVYEIISQYLLGSTLPEEEERVEQIIVKFRIMFQEIHLGVWEGDYTTAIFHHLLRNSSKIRDRLCKVLEREDDFRDFHLPYAKRDINELVYKDCNHLLNESMKEDLTDHRRPPNIGTIQFLLENCKRAISSFMIDRAATFLKLLISQTLIHPSLEFDLMEFINTIQDVTKVAQVWSRLYPNLITKEIGFGEYRWIFAQKHHTHLQAAGRQMLAMNMESSSSKSIRNLGIFLKDIWCIYNPIQDGQLQEKFDQVAHLLRTNDDEDIEVFVICMEFIMRLIEYFERGALVFLSHMNENKRFRKTIAACITHIIKIDIKSWYQENEAFCLVHSNLEHFSQKILLIHDELWVNNPNGVHSDLMIQEQLVCLKNDSMQLTLVIEGHHLAFSPKFLKSNPFHSNTP